MTPDNIAPKPDYQQQSVEAIADKLKDNLTLWEFMDKPNKDFLMNGLRKRAEELLAAADAVPRPTHSVIWNDIDISPYPDRHYGASPDSTLRRDY